MKDIIGPVDWIFLSNSYWLDNNTPCLTYGLRGVIHATVEVSSGRPDSHSGVEGGSIQEPMIDLINLLAYLTANGKITLPSFYDNVRKLTPDEDRFYSAITQKWYTPPYDADKFRFGASVNGKMASSIVDNS
jgi:di- and tripeptidase